MSLPSKHSSMKQTKEWQEWNGNQLVISMVPVLGRDKT